jgi:uncharacterized FlaG/YvyC family protein
MEVRVSEATRAENTRSALSLRGLVPGGVLSVKSRPATLLPSSIEAANNAEVEITDAAFGNQTLSQTMEQTADLLSMFDRELKYEVMEDAGVVQLQVIDSSDGTVVRKVPADEVIKFLEVMKKKIDDRVYDPDDRVDVWA